MSTIMHANNSHRALDLLILWILFSLAFLPTPVSAHHKHHKKRPDHCEIGGVRYENQQLNPWNVCNICYPETSANSWTNISGGRCDDGNPATYNDVCQSNGTCRGTPYTCPSSTVCRQTLAYDGTGICKYNYLPGTTCRQPTDVCDIPTKCINNSSECPPYSTQLPPVVVVTPGTVTQPTFTNITDAALFNWSGAGVSCGDLSYTYYIADAGTKEWVALDVAPNAGTTTRTWPTPGPAGVATGDLAQPLYTSIPALREGDRYLVRVQSTNIHGRYIRESGNIVATAESATYTTVDYTKPTLGNIIHRNSANEPNAQPQYTSATRLEATYDGWVDDTSGIHDCQIELWHYPRTTSKNAEAENDPHSTIYTTATGTAQPRTTHQGAAAFDVKELVAAGTVHDGDRFRWRMRCRDLVNDYTDWASSSQLLYDASVPTCGKFMMVDPDSRPDDLSDAAQALYTNDTGILRYRWAACTSASEPYDIWGQAGMGTYTTRVVDTTTNEEVKPWAEVAGAHEVLLREHNLTVHAHVYGAGLRACSRAGVCKEIATQTPGLLVDTTEPEESTITYVQRNAVYHDNAYTSNNAAVDVEWTPFHDPESGVVSACIMIYTDDADFMRRFPAPCIPIPDVAEPPFSPAPRPDAPTSQHIPVVVNGYGQIPNGTAVRVEVHVCNRARSCRIMQSRVLIVDASAPARNTVVDPTRVVVTGTLRQPATIPYVSSFESFTVDLRGVIDHESHCRNVDFAVVRAADGAVEASPTANFWPYTDDATNQTAPPTTTYTLHFTPPPAYTNESELQPSANYLRPNIDYQIRATVYNGAGLTASFLSVPFRADATPPLPFTAYPVDTTDPYNVTRLRWTDDVYNLSVATEPATDHESPIVDYTFRLHDVTGLPAGSVGTLLTQFPVGPNTEATLIFGRGDVPALSQGRTYALTARAMNAAGHTTDSAQSLLTVDLTPPICGTAWPGTPTAPARFQTNSSELALAWQGFSDPESGIDRYEYTIAPSRDLTNIAGKVYTGALVYPSDGSHGSQTIMGLSLETGRYYYVAVRAYNPVGRFCQAISETGVFIDAEAPEPARVCGGRQRAVGVCVQRGQGVGVTDQIYVNDSTHALVHWSHFHDQFLVIDHHRVCIGTGPGLCDITSRDNIPGTVYTAEIPFPAPVADKFTYYATVYATDEAGLTGQAASGPITVDTGSPVFPGTATPTSPATSPARLVSSNGAAAAASEPWTARTDQVHARVQAASAVSGVLRHRACLVKGSHADSAEIWPKIPTEELSPASAAPAVGCVSSILTGDTGSADLAGLVLFSFVAGRTMELPLEPGYRYRVVGTAVSGTGRVTAFVSPTIISDPGFPLPGYAHTKTTATAAPTTDTECTDLAEAGAAAGRPVSGDQVDFTNIIYVNGLSTAPSALFVRLCGAHGAAAAAALATVELRVRHGVMGMDDDYVPELAQTVKAADYLSTKTDAARALTLDFTKAHDIVPGDLYQPEVTVRSHAGLVAAAFPAAVMVVTEPPAPGTVHVGAPGTAVAYITDRRNFSVFWSVWTSNHGPISGYSLCITNNAESTCTGTAPASAPVVGRWIDPAAGATTFTFTDTQGLQDAFYVTVRGCNMVGMCTTATTTQITISDIPPTAGTVTIVGETSPAYVTDTSVVEVTWQGFHAHASVVAGSLAGFTVALGSAAGRDDIMPFRSVGLSTSYTFNIAQEQAAAAAAASAARAPPTFTAPAHGAPIYATVIATDRAGNHAQASSEAAFYALTEPAIAQTYLTIYPETEDTEGVTVPFSLHLGAVTEAVAGVAACEVAFGAARGGAQYGVQSISAADCTKGTATGKVVLPAGAADVELWATVYATSGAGLVALLSAPAPVHVRPPLPPALAPKSWCRSYAPIASILSEDLDHYQPVLVWSETHCETAVPLPTGGQGVILRPFGPENPTYVITEPLVSANVDIKNTLTGDVIATSGETLWDHIAAQLSADTSTTGTTLLPNSGAGYVLSDEFEISVPVTPGAVIGLATVATTTSSVPAHRTRTEATKHFAPPVPITSEPTNAPVYAPDFAQFMLEWVVESAYAPLSEFAAEIWGKGLGANGEDVLVLSRFLLNSFRAREDALAVIVATTPYAGAAIEAAVAQAGKPLDGEYSFYARLFATDTAGHFITDTTPAVPVSLAELPSSTTTTAVFLVSHDPLKPLATPNLGHTLSATVTRSVVSATNADCRLSVGRGAGGADVAGPLLVGGKTTETFTTRAVTTPGSYVATLSCPDGIYFSEPVVVDPAPPTFTAAATFAPTVTRMPQDTEVTTQDKVEHTIAVTVPLAATIYADIIAYDVSVVAGEAVHSWILETPKAISDATDGDHLSLTAEGVLLPLGESVYIHVVATASTGVRTETSSAPIPVDSTMPYARTRPSALPQLLLDDSLAARATRGAETVAAALTVSWMPMDPVLRGELVGTAGAVSGGFGSAPIVISHNIEVQCASADGLYTTVGTATTSIETETTVPLAGVAGQAVLGPVRCRAHVSACTQQSVCERAVTEDVVFDIQPSEYGFAINLH